MKKWIQLILLMMLLTSCGNQAQDDDRLQVVSSFTIITNMIEEIGQEHVQVHNLVPIGTDPHEYEPLPQDIKKVSDAKVVFFNGMNLEGGKTGWLQKLLDSTNNPSRFVVDLSEGVTPMYLSENSFDFNHINPHIFNSPKNGLIMAKNVLKALSEIDPKHKEYYENNAQNYFKQLEEMNQMYENGFKSVEPKKRNLVTSENAFQYLGRDYDVSLYYIWSIDTEENGSPSQIKNLINQLKKVDVSTLFVESNVDRRPMETVSKETGISIYSIPVYSDEIGSKKENADTYLLFLKHNLETILEGMKL